MNKQDLQIISYIRNNSRNPIEKMSQDMGLSFSETIEKLKIYEKNYIKNYTCVLNFSKTGFKLDINILIKIPEQDKKGFEKFIVKEKNINSFFLLDDGRYLIESIFKNEKKLNKFLDKINNNFPESEIQILKISKEFKREAFLED